MTMKQEKKRIYLRAALALAALLLVLLALDNLSFVPSMLLTVLRKGAIYALVAVSMNLLNGFTGLFSLGQAGFMLLGAYTYAILTIPAASQKSIYQRYANGGIGFSIPELLSKPLGGFGLLLGVVFCLILAGFIAALFAFLIGLPVLKLKLVKTCPDHGTFSSVIWRNKRKFADWRGERPAVGENENLNCPAGCGLCAEHRRATCCTLLEITARCNMNCTFCFAEPDGTQDPSLDTVKRWIDDLTEPGKTLLQLSGGEPTVRDDLPEIVAYAKQVGCKYVQLNSNGLRLAEDEAFVKRLADAGLSFVFMQFDGVDDAVYEKLRRRPMLEVKKRAIEQCGRYGIGVTLVPVIVPGVNTEQIGDIIRFAIQRSPYVRGVHFQPVSYFGRIPELPADDDRYTLDELLEAVVSQSGGLIKEEQIAPSCCDHPMCGFHGDFIVMPGDKLMPLTNYSGKTETEPEGEGCCCGPDPAEKNREFVGRRWERRDLEETCCCGESQPENMTEVILYG